jgi:hypothetical protein
MAETRNETQILVSEDVPMVTLIREFDAAPDEVIVRRLHAKAPGVPIIGSAYYNPLLGAWVLAPRPAQRASLLARADARLATTSVFVTIGLVPMPGSHTFLCLPRT